jgi:oligopeptidase B
VADGTAPGLLHGYGAYGIPSDPWFSVLRLSLLQRGWVFAIAHVRGGSEMGRSWYDDGKLTAKPHTFSDFVACADHLRDSGIVAPDRLAAEGGSAGGLLMGVVANQAPDRFRFIHASVPFVDALTTILDPAMPLTVIEWEEWGNPLEDPAAYALMKSYTPYENVCAQRYPALLITTSLHDTRVYVTEPAKWVAALRHETRDVAGADPLPHRDGGWSRRAVGALRHVAAVGLGDVRAPRGHDRAVHGAGRTLRRGGAALRRLLDSCP